MTLTQLVHMAVALHHCSIRQARLAASTPGPAMLAARFRK